MVKVNVVVASYQCNKVFPHLAIISIIITSTGKVNSTRLRLVQLVSLPLLVTRAINPICMHA